MKDPERVRTGRMGGLTTKALGHHNTRPAVRASKARIAALYGISDDLPEGEYRRRMAAAMRVEMSRIARKRWDDWRARRREP